MTNKKIIIGFAIAFIISLNIYNIPFKNKVVEAAPPSNNQPMSQSIDLTSLNKAINQASGQVFDLNRYDHVIVSFWATWCPSCRRENLIFNEYVQNNRNVLILGISVDKDPKALVEFFFQKTKQQLMQLKLQLLVEVLQLINFYHYCNNRKKILLKDQNQ